MGEPLQKSSAPSFGEEIGNFARWCGENPVRAALLGGLLGTLLYFFQFHRIFMNGTESALLWAYHAWNEPNDLEHGIFIIPAAIVVAWMHRQDFRAAIK